MSDFKVQRPKITKKHKTQAFESKIILKTQNSIDKKE